MSSPALRPGGERALDGTGVLALWEALDAADRALHGAVVLVARGRAAGLRDACDLPLRDAAAEALAELRERCGPVLATLATCDACGQVLDVDLDLDEMNASAVESPARAIVSTPRGDVVVSAPTTQDLLVALDDPDPARVLRERCASWPAGADRDDAQLSAAVQSAADELAGLAASSVRAQCPACGAAVSADVDVVALLAARVAQDARDLLVDVAELARAYGWSQKSILAMSTTRRRAYLELAQG